MADIVDAATRSRMMSGIRGKHTWPEMVVRKGLHARGFRYRLHDRRLPGAPDLVLPARGVAIFVHGCFWHGHDCHLFRIPSTRQEFWQAKIASNRARDNAAEHMLRESGWRVLTIWECALKGRTRLPENVVLDRVAEWIVNGPATGTIAGDADVSQ